MPEIGAGELESGVAARREKLLNIYGEALDMALELVEHITDAIDRLAEVDGAMTEYLEHEQKTGGGAD